MPNVPPEFINKTFYGQVNYFFMYKFMDQENMLANIKWADKVSEDALGTIFFTSYGATQFINVNAIDRCIGFMKLGSKTYIIDKEYMEQYSINNIY